MSDSLPDAETQSSSDHNSTQDNRYNTSKSASEQQVAPTGRSGKVSLVTLLTCGVTFLLGAGAATLWEHRAENAPVVIINGEAITTPAFHHKLEIAAGTNVFTQMVDERLQAQMAARDKVAPTDAEVQAKFDEVTKQSGFLDQMKKTNQTAEDVKSNIRANLTQQALVTKGLTVSDDEVQKFYAFNTDPRNPQARYYRPETVRIAAIITDKPEDIKTALHDLASGVAFTQVAARYSKDQSRANGGVLPPIRKGQTDEKKLPGLEKTIFALKVGQQVDTFKSANMFWIIRCVARDDELKVPFEKVKEECRLGALLAKGTELNGKDLQAKYAEFRKEAKIDILRPEYKDALTPKQ